MRVGALGRLRRPRRPAADGDLSAVLLEHLSDGVIACDADGSTLTFNRKAREIFGPPDAHVTQQECAEYFALHAPGEERHMPMTDVPLARALNGERVRDMAVEVRPRNGRRRILTVSGEPIRRRRRILGAVVVVRDVTARAELEAALELKAAVTEHMTQSVLVVRAADGEVVYANDAAERLFGYRAAELVGLPMSRLNVGTGREPAERASEILAALERSGVWSAQMECARKDGTHIPCAVTVSPFDHVGQGTLWIAVHTGVAA
jgi:PAS domain S-box-containing protein